MPDKTWKSVERKICRFFGTEREKREGERGWPDGVTDTLKIQVKHRKSFPAWLTGALVELEAWPDDKGRTPILCLHSKNQRIEDTLVITRAKYLKGV